MLDIKRLINDYNRLKELAYQYNERKDYNNALHSIAACARIGYEFNFIDKFGDDDLDSLLMSISSNQLSIDVFESNDRRIVFYDCFGLDNRGLTEQYLKALIDLKYEILYILSNDVYFGSSKNIISLLKNAPNCKYNILSDKLTYIKRSQIICDLIYVFKPSKAFLHFSPCDIVGFLTFTRLNGCLKRFFINITDHAFWLGKNTFDVCIEFRNYGLSLSCAKRHIELEKLTILPYYPVIKTEEKYLGLEFENKLVGKIVGITGGHAYKYLDKNLKYYKLIYAIMSANNSFVLIMVGTGRAGLLMKKKAEKDGFGDRLFLLNTRPDILQLLQRCDIYISSYPFGGGLMIQLAATANLPILAFSEPEYQYNFLEELLPHRDPQFHTFTNLKDCINTGIRLTTDIDYRNEYRKFTQDSVITSDDFKTNLEIVVKKAKIDIIIKQGNYNIDNVADVMSHLFIDVENEYMHKYDECINAAISNLPEDVKILFTPLWPKRRLANKLQLKLMRRLEGLNRSPKVLLKSLVNKITRKMANISEIKNYKFNKLGSNSRIPVQSTIINPHYISIGNDFSAHQNLRIEALDAYAGERFYPEIIIGNGVLMNTDIHIGCINKIIIGNNVLLASRIYISDHSHGEITKDALKLPPKFRPLKSKGPVIIKDNVWIGEGVAILPGVTIGENSIIGANTVVTNNVPANCVVAGNPAKILKELV